MLDSFFLICVCMHVCIYVCMHVCMYACECLCVCVWVCMCVCAILTMSLWKKVLWASLKGCNRQAHQQPSCPCQDHPIAQHIFERLLREVRWRVQQFIIGRKLAEINNIDLLVCLLTFPSFFSIKIKQKNSTLLLLAEDQDAPTPSLDRDDIVLQDN